MPAAQNPFGSHIETVCGNPFSSGGDDGAGEAQLDAEDVVDPLLKGHDTTFATSADTVCGYSSPRGACRLIAASGFGFCTVHLCPKGCGRKKGSREADCGQQCTAHGAAAPHGADRASSAAGPAAPTAAPLTLLEQADVIKSELGLAAGLSIPAAVNEACLLLGLSPEHTTLPGKMTAILALIAPSSAAAAADAPPTGGATGEYDNMEPDAACGGAETLAHIEGTRAQWFQHHLTRQTAEAMLQQSGRQGQFVIRKSSQEGFYSLSCLAQGGACWHGLVRYLPNGQFDMQGAGPWATLDALVHALMTTVATGNAALPPVLCVI